MLPGLDGLELCRRLRAAHILSPVLMITARDTVDNKVEGLDSGADDYIVKPIAIRELLARIRALLRRGVSAPAVLCVADLKLDPAARQASRGGKTITLSATEYALLEYLMRNAGRVLTRSMIMEHVWHYDFDGNDNVLDVYIGYLRSKIDRNQSPPPRHTAQNNANAVLQTAVRKIQGDYTDAQKDKENSGWLDDSNELTQQNLALVVVDAQGRVTPKTPGKVPNWPRSDKDQWRIRTVRLGSDTVVIGYYWEKTELMLRLQALMLLALSLALFLAAMFGAWILVGRTLSPIYGLSMQADTASADNLRIHLETPSEDTEIVHLVGTLNALMGRLAGAISARERFYAAASHELRTPIQTLTGYLELALMRERNSADYRAALEEAFSQSERLASLVQALLLLNQLEATPVREKEIVDINDSFYRWIAELIQLAKSRGLRFTVRPSEAVFIQSTASHLDILVRNLLENAVKYAERDSEIQVCIAVSPKGTCLNIFNKCQPLPEWDEAKLFEPFYRPDVSHNSVTGGNGLGLAICRAVAAANGWNLSLKQEGDGVSARVIFMRHDHPD